MKIQKQNEIQKKIHDFYLSLGNKILKKLCNKPYYISKYFDLKKVLKILFYLWSMSTCIQNNGSNEASESPQSRSPPLNHAHLDAGFVRVSAASRYPACGNLERNGWRCHQDKKQRSISSPPARAHISPFLLTVS